MTSPIRPFVLRTSGAVSDDPYDAQWQLKVGDRIYGPYTGHQMSAFHVQGRLAAHSMVSRIGASTVEAQWHTAATDSVLGAMFRASKAATATFGQRAEPGSSKFVIVVELKGRNSTPLENAILSLGRACRVATNVWLLSGTHTVSGLRNHLSQHLGPTDWLMIVDACHARTAGYNMGPENDAQIRRVWRDETAKDS